MTTWYSFFTKLFNENENSKYLYKNYDFSNYSPDSHNFLNKLSIITKYKEVLKSFLISRKIKVQDKHNYILRYKENLTFDQYIKYNVTMEIREESLLHSTYIFGLLNIFFFIFYIIKRPVDAHLSKDMSKSLIFSSILTIAYHHNNMKQYKINLDDIYKKLEIKMNAFPELKDLKINNNVLTEDNINDED